VIVIIVVDIHCFRLAVVVAIMIEPAALIEQVFRVTNTATGLLHAIAALLAGMTRYASRAARAVGPPPSEREGCYGAGSGSLGVLQCRKGPSQLLEYVFDLVNDAVRFC
jgi:hypothetical protein